MTTRVSPRQVALQFDIRLRREIGEENYGMVRLRNAGAEYADCCASHDFCDANMVMADALEFYDLDPCAMEDAAVTLWNAAWDLWRNERIDALAEMQANRAQCADIGESLSDSSLMGISGYLYYGGLYIEDSQSWNQDQPNPRLRGRFYTLIGRCEYSSDNLAEIELRLAEFAASEGYMDPKSA